MIPSVLLTAGQARTVHSGVGTYAGLLLQGLGDLAPGRLTVAVATWREELAADRHPQFEWIDLGPRPRFDPTPGRFWSLGRAVAAWLRGGRRFDVVHCLDAREGHALARSRCRAGMRLVGTVHDDYAALVGPSPAHYFGQASDPLRRWLFHRWQRRLERRTYRAFDRLMVNSAATAATLRTAYGLPADLLQPVTLTIAAAPPPGAPAALVGRPSLVFSGGNFHRKGLDVCVRAMPEVLAALPEARLHVVGSCRSQRHIERLVWRLGLRSSVQFHGRVDPARMAALTAVAGMFVMPSRTEALGLVYLEAFRAGVPVIAGDRGGVTEIVRQGESGLLVPAGDAAAVAAAVVRLSREPELRARLVAGGRAVLAARTPELLLRQTLVGYGLQLDASAAGTSSLTEPALAVAR